jgi:hypothetical protein
MASEAGGVGLVIPTYEFDEGLKERIMDLKDSNATLQRGAA